MLKQKWKWAWHTARMKNKVDYMLHKVATKKREEIKGTTKRKMAKRHCKEGWNHLEQKSNRQRTMEDTDGGLHPAVDGESLGKKV